MHRTREVLQHNIPFCFGTGYISLSMKQNTNHSSKSLIKHHSISWSAERTLGIAYPNIPLLNAESEISDTSFLTSHAQFICIQYNSFWNSLCWTFIIFKIICLELFHNSSCTIAEQNGYLRHKFKMIMSYTREKEHQGDNSCTI